MSEPIHSGLLDLKKNGKWTRKLVKVKKSRLCWYSKTGKGSSEGFMVLDKETEVQALRFGLRKFMFEVRGEDKSVQFVASGDAEMIDWIEAIKFGQGKKAKKPKAHPRDVLGKKKEHTKNDSGGLESILDSIDQKESLRLTESKSGDASRANQKLKSKLAGNVSVGAEAASKCGACRKPISAGAGQILVDGKKLHKNCFQCVICSKKLSNDAYWNLGGMWYCRQHYLDITSGSATEQKTSETSKEALGGETRNKRSSSAMIMRKISKRFSKFTVSNASKLKVEGAAEPDSETPPKPPNDDTIISGEVDKTNDKKSRKTSKKYTAPLSIGRRGSKSSVGETPGPGEVQTRPRKASKSLYLRRKKSTDGKAAENMIRAASKDSEDKTTKPEQSDSVKSISAKFESKASSDTKPAGLNKTEKTTPASSAQKRTSKIFEKKEKGLDVSAAKKDEVCSKQKEQPPVDEKKQDKKAREDEKKIPRKTDSKVSENEKKQIIKGDNKALDNEKKEVEKPKEEPKRLAKTIEPKIILPRQEVTPVENKPKPKPKTKQGNPSEPTKEMNHAVMSRPVMNRRRRPPKALVAKQVPKALLPAKNDKEKLTHDLTFKVDDCTDQVMTCHCTSASERDQWTSTIANVIHKKSLELKLKEAQRVDMMSALQAQAALENFMKVAEFEYAGFMEKLAVKSKRNWKKRYFVLKDDKFTYYADSKMKKRLRVLKLTPDSVVMNVQHKIIKPVT
uniref:Uncharacterized protein n=1 Tax=Mucochytrium quahogii TaxID=96639 RepID=A0A7S2WQS7_9STRA|mmetsp:Transcript_34645/g.55379  ORF Transcript_34645/g.55379 Transcript_34645/m.55379 type:complete len:734 (+) Transcript_34645:1259-3460(+)